MRSVSREEIRQVECRKCGANPGSKCFGAKGSRRESNHFIRMQDAQEAILGATIRSRQKSTQSNKTTQFSCDRCFDLKFITIETWKNGARTVPCSCQQRL